jgi:hypothetical protein
MEQPFLFFVVEVKCVSNLVGRLPLDVSQDDHLPERRRHLPDGGAGLVDGPDVLAARAPDSGRDRPVTRPLGIVGGEETIR